MKIKRSQSLSNVVVMSNNARNNSFIRTAYNKQSPPIQQCQSPQKLRKSSLSKIRSRTLLSSSQQRKNNSKNNIIKSSSLQVNKMHQFKQTIISYIQKRSDVQIINYYNQYKQQFFRKSTNLQNLFYQQPQIRHRYLNQQQDMHFYKGFQHTLLQLFRKGLIVPGEYRNMRVETVERIEKWVFSWIRRKQNYQQAIEEEMRATQDVMNVVVGEIALYAKAMKEQKPYF